MTPARRKRFLGPSEHTVDKKGRMSFAKRFQDALDRDDENRPYGVMCLEPSHGRCIWVFNDEGFDQEMEGFGTGAFAAEGSAEGSADLDSQRDFFEFVAEFTLDTSGRLVLPARFREIAGIGDEVVAVGMRSRAEIWSKDRWGERHRGAKSPLHRASGPGVQA
ncbi:MAG: hypothetical protein P8R46_12520 [Planctomycetota bacterium]|nr:hypothetical protein [Planctomycetota bacterium]